MALADQLARDSLRKLRRHPLSIKRPLAPAANCSITESSGLYALTSTVNLAQLEYPTVVEIRGGPADGFYPIVFVGDSYVLIAGGAEQNYGQVIYYNFDFENIADMCGIAISQAETYSQQSFRGVKNFTERRRGNGTTRLIMQRRRMRSITEITPYFQPTYPGFLIKIQVSDIDYEQAINTGILDITSTAATGGTLLQLGYQHSKYFPHMKIEITGTYGYDYDSTDPEDAIPDDCYKAMVNLSCAIILSEDLSQGGNVNNLSSEGTSLTMDIGRDIASYTNIAYSLLSPWTSGVVGS